MLNNAPGRHSASLPQDRASPLERNGAATPATAAEVSDGVEPILASTGSPGASAEMSPEPLRRPSLVVSALSNWAGFAVNVIIGFLLTPFVIAHLGKSGYGIWTLVGSIVGYYGMLDLGVASAVTRYVARHAARRDYRALNETVSTALVMFCLVGAVILAVSFTADIPLARFLEVADDQIPAFRYALWLLALGAVVNLIGQVFRATINAHEYFVIRNSIIIVTTLGRAALTVWALQRGLGLLGVAISYLAADACSLIVNLILCRKLIPEIRPHVRLARWYALVELLGFGITSTIIVAANIVRFNLDSAVISKLISLEAVAVFGVAAVLLRYFANLVNTLMGVLTPRFSGLHGLGDLTRFRALLIRALWISSMLSCVAGVQLLILGRRFIFLWVGPGFEEAATVLALLTISSIVGLSNSPSVLALYAMNKHKYFAAATVVEGICNLVLSILFATRMGVVGVALGTMIPHLINQGIVQPVYVSVITGVGLTRYYWAVGGSALAAAVLYAGWQWTVAPHVTDLGYVGLCAAGICIVGAYAALLLIGLVLLSAVGLQPVALPWNLLTGPTRRAPAIEGVAG